MDLKKAAAEFQKLNVRKYGEKLESVNDVKLLDFLKEVESNSDKPRTTVLEAIDAQKEKVQENLKGDPEPKNSDANMSKDKVMSEENATELNEEETEETKTSDSEGENLEEVQDENLDEFKKEVAKITDPEKLKELYEIEKRDDHRKGAFEILEKRLEEISQTDEITRQTISFDYDLIRKYRLQLDRLATKVEKHMKIDDDLEVGKKLFMAKSWLGKLLEELGADNPYKGEHKIKSRNDIPAAADADESIEYSIKARNFSLKNTLDAVLELREELEEIAQDLEKIHLQNVSREANASRTNAWSAVREAKYLLGKELQQLRTK